MCARQAPRMGGFGLRAQTRTYVGVGRFAGTLGFERLGVLVGTRQQQLETHAELLQQFLPSRTLRREINEG